MSDVQKQEKTSLLDKKLAELKRLQEEIRQLRDDLDEQQQIGLDLQVFEVNQTKIRNLGFDWDIEHEFNSSHQDAAGFCKALSRNGLAKTFGGRNKRTPNGTRANFLLDDGTKTAVSFECTPTLLDEGKIRLKVRFEISRFSGEDFGMKVRAGETTIEVDPDSRFFIAGDSFTRTTAKGDKEEISLVFVIKPSLSKR